MPPLKLENKNVPEMKQRLRIWGCCGGQIAPDKGAGIPVMVWSDNTQQLNSDNFIYLDLQVAPH